MYEEFTEVDTKSDFEKFKDGNLYYYQIRGFGDEHKWWILKNRQDCTFLKCEKEMTDEMLRWCLTNGLCDFYDSGKLGKRDNKRLMKRILSLNLSEEEWLCGIEKRKVGRTQSVRCLDDFFMLIMEYAKTNGEEVPLQLAKAIVKKSPKFIVDRGLRKTITDDPDANKEVTECVVQFVINSGESVPLFPELIIEEYLWECISKNIKKFDKKYIFQRPDVPRELKVREIESDVYCLALRDNMTVDDVLTWYNHYNNMLPRGLFSNIINSFKCDNWNCVVEKAPGVFEFLYKPNAETCKAAVKAYSGNIKYIEEPSEELKELAASLETEQNLQEEEKEEKASNPYTAKYYLVRFRENLCDEDDLCHVRIVKGENMEKFMGGTFRISFGNLDDDETRYVKDCAKVYEITEEEIGILEKFGLDSIKSGYFGFSADMF